ncbi:PXDN-like protein, partial [Mya arenaria]
MLNDLKTLDMSHNLIKVFDTVPHLPELQTWYLDSNLIETVHVGDHIWTYAESLQNLYMRNNQIMRFAPGDLPLDLGTLKVLDLSNNEIHCDCRMKWIASAVVEDKANRDIVLKCRYLSRVNGKDLLSLPEEELNCNIPPGKIIFIVSMAAIVAVCVGLIAFFVVRSIRRRFKIRRATKSDNK